MSAEEIYLMKKNDRFSILSFVKPDDEQSFYREQMVKRHLYFCYEVNYIKVPRYDVDLYTEISRGKYQDIKAQMLAYNRNEILEDVKNAQGL